jgi:hypothetical protein
MFYNLNRDKGMIKKLINYPLRRAIKDPVSREEKLKAYYIQTIIELDRIDEI